MACQCIVQQNDAAKRHGNANRHRKLERDRLLEDRDWPRRVNAWHSSVCQSAVTEFHGRGCGALPWPGRILVRIPFQDSEYVLLCDSVPRKAWSHHRAHCHRRTGPRRERSSRVRLGVPCWPSLPGGLQATLTRPRGRRLGAGRLDPSGKSGNPPSCQPGQLLRLEFASA